MNGGSVEAGRGSQNTDLEMANGNHWFSFLLVR